MIHGGASRQPGGKAHRHLSRDRSIERDRGAPNDDSADLSLARFECGGDASARVVLHFGVTAITRSTAVFVPGPASRD
jgi:hypothetical protein